MSFQVQPSNVFAGDERRRSAESSSSGKMPPPNVYWVSLILHDNPESSMKLNLWHTMLSKETQRKNNSTVKTRQNRDVPERKETCNHSNLRRLPGKSIARPSILCLNQAIKPLLYYHMQPQGIIPFQSKEPLASILRLGPFRLYQSARQQTRARLSLTSANPLSSIAAKTSSWNEPKTWLHEIIWKHLLKENAASHDKKLKAGD